MRVASPRFERSAAARPCALFFPLRAVEEAWGCYGRTHLGPYTAQKVRFHLRHYSWRQRQRHTRIRAGLEMGYTMYRLLPVDDLRRLHEPVAGNPHLLYYELMPKGMAAKDLACLNLYLELVAWVEPCPFPLLVKRGLWENEAWRALGKTSDMWGEF